LAESLISSFAGLLLFTGISFYDGLFPFESLSNYK
jgi:hypothetical protein